MDEKIQQLTNEQLLDVIVLGSVENYRELIKLAHN